MKRIILVSFLVIATSCQDSNDELPVRVSVSSSNQCPSATNQVSITPSISEAIQIYLESLNATCDCANDATWTRVGYLDMSDSSQSCPGVWHFITSNSVRACGRRSGSCNSVFYSSHGTQYSQVCGHIVGYQYGHTDAFNIGTHLDSHYIEGVSLTHGQPGSRTHVWSFVNAYSETARGSQTCPCMLSDPSTWPHSVPSFVGNNYFCDTGSRNSPTNHLYTDNPLWDGVGCTGHKTCCQFNQPPWFCRTLPTPTTDDLEVRICGSRSASSENTYISNLELYIK